MGVWGRDSKANNETPLETAIRWLNPKAKQAFYAASLKVDVIERGTWNGCAFNAGSNILGGNVKGIETAAEFFDLPSVTVSKFISAWDNLRGSDEEAKKILQDTILKVGLFTPRGSEGLRKLKIVSKTVFESTMDKEERRAVEIQETVFQENITDAEIHAMIEGYKDALELLNV